MKFFLNDRNAIARALMVGYLVWCEETGEGWQANPGVTWRSARHTAAVIMHYCDGKTFVTFGDR